MAETAFRINDVDFLCEFVLTNSDGQTMEFNKTAIEKLKISDNVFNPFMDGEITIYNPFDLIEKNLFLRGDGRDELSIKFKFKDSDKFKRGFHEEFIIVDDLNEEINRRDNYKTFMLMAKDSRPFMDEIPYNKRYIGKVGALIKSLFIELLGEESVDEEVWDDGDISIDFTTPSTFRYLDVLNYFLKIYCGKDEDMFSKAILSKNPTTRKYELELISKIFETNKDRGQECFFVGDEKSSPSSFNNQNNPPDDTTTYSQVFLNDLRSLGISTPFFEWTNNYFLNSLVYAYNPILGTMEVRKILLDDVIEKFIKKYVEPFKAIGGKVKDFIIKNRKTDKIFKRYRLPYSISTNSKIVESDMYNNLVFYNLQLSLTNYGNPERESGKFIDVVSSVKLSDDNIDNKIDQKLIGRWFVTEVVHMFTRTTYNNVIFSTKTYIGPKANINTDVD